MKKILLVLFLLFIPLQVNAKNLDFEFLLEETIDQESEVNGSNLYIGNQVESNSVTEGIFFSIANNLTLGGTSDYTMLVSNNIAFSQTVLNDAFILGNIVEIKKEASISRDLYMVGYTVTLDGEVGRDATIVGQDVYVNSSNIRDLEIIATNITIGDNVNIENLKYNEDAVISIASSATINNTILSEAMDSELSFIDNVNNIIIGYITDLVTFLGLVIIMPFMFKKINDKFKDLSFVNIFQTFGIGALSLIIVPIVGMLLFSLVFGIPFAVLLFAIYGLALLLSTVIVSYLIGLIVSKVIIKKELNIFLIGLIGISILHILFLIPVVSEVVLIMVIFFGMGIIARTFTK